MRLALGAALTLALVPLVARDARASGFMVRENSAESVGMIYAGDASRADEAATVFNNPAGMMHLAGPEVEVGVGLALPSIQFSGSATAVGGTIPITGTQGGQPGVNTAIPNLYAVVNLTDSVRLGLAVTVPFGNTVDYKANFIGRYQSLKTEALSADINPNIAWRITDKVSIGAGVSAQWLKVEQSTAIAQFLILKTAAPDAEFLFNGANWNVGFNAGLLLEPNATTRLGFTYRSGVDHKLEGTLHYTGANPALGLVNLAAEGRGLDLPGTAAVSFTHDWSAKWSASAELQFNQWSSFKEVQVTTLAPTRLAEPEYYRNSWMITAGAVYHATSDLALRAGIGWDQSPVTDEFRTIGIPDADRYMVGAGAGYTVVPGLAVVDFGYAHYFGIGKATITGSANSVDPITGAVVLTGDFHNHLDFFALSFRFML